MIPHNEDITPDRYPSSVGVTALDLTCFDPSKYGTVVAIRLERIRSGKFNSPASERIAELFCSTPPVAPSHLVRALSVDDTGPVTIEAGTVVAHELPFQV